MRHPAYRCISLILAVAGLGLLAPVTEGEACSICRCGDVTFNALGKAGYNTPGLRVALDSERFDKAEGRHEEVSVGNHEDEAEAHHEEEAEDHHAHGAESQVEKRVTALISYGFTERFMMTARVPYSIRDLTVAATGEQPETIHTSGLSDPEIYGQVRLWGSGLPGGLGRRASLSLIAGVKTAWGRNDAQHEGHRIDEHAQPGTGSTDLLASLALLYLVDSESALFVSGGYRHTGDNDYGYRYGSTFLANLAYEHKGGSRLDGVVELNFRHAKKDRVDTQGTLGDDTGGSLLYVTPRLLVNLGRGLVLRAAAQIPAVRDLNGFQKERVVANLGLTWLLSH